MPGFFYLIYSIPFTVLRGICSLQLRMNYILFDSNRDQLLPFTHTRAVADIRCGILSMRERWEMILQQKTGTLTEEYLQPLYPAEQGENFIFINGSIAATCELVSAVLKLTAGQQLVQGDVVIGSYTNADSAAETVTIAYPGEVTQLRHIWDIFSLNDKLIREDFQLLTFERKSATLPGNIFITGKENVFIEEGATINAGCIINAATGPVYIGKGAEILEGTMIRGPLAVCENGGIKMGAKIYGATTIGPGCKVGGEINNTVFFANSNKGHDGYLGNAVIGEWCNLGADTNCSNLKNNYDVVKVWSEAENKLVNTGLTFCGLMMGDHSKCGINTMFNTGTVVGVSANIYGGGFPEKFIPSFTWGGSDSMVTYEFDKAMDTANRMMQRRGKQISTGEIAAYRHIFDQTASQREQ